jgi:hypothetical protein
VKGLDRVLYVVSALTRGQAENHNRLMEPRPRAVNQTRHCKISKHEVGLLDRYAASVLNKNLTVVQLVKKFAVFCENRTFITVRFEGLHTAVTVNDTEEFCCLEYQAI